MSAAFEQWLKRSIYMPKLPWKKGEIDAFKSVSPAVNNFTTPIFVIPPAGSFDHEKKRILSPAEHIRLFGPRLEKARQNRPVFVDAIYLDNVRHRAAFNVHPLTALLERARLGRSQAWPLTSYGRSDEYQQAVAKAHLTHGSPVAMQIRIADLGAASLADRLKSLCNQVSCDPQEAVLVVDCGPLFLPDESKEEEFTEGLINALNQLPRLYEWNQIVLVATSLGGIHKIKQHEEKLIRRSEWHIYTKLLQRRGELYRLPVFSDYGIDYRESLVPIKAQPSAKLNYTTDVAQFFVKGANVGNGGYQAIFPVAEKIASSTHFMGIDFSRGDERIWLLAHRRTNTGHAPTWRWACADHHLMVVGNALFKAFGVPTQEFFKLIEVQQTELFPTVPAK